MQLRHDDALCAIDHEGTVIGHERHFTEIHFLLANILNRFWRPAGFFVINNESNHDANRCGIGQTTHLTFFDVEYRLAEAVAHVFECRIARIADNRKNRLKCSVQTSVVTLFNRLVRLQEFLVRIYLDRQQVRNFENRRPFAKVLADALFLSE